MYFCDKTIKQFNEELASKSPVPGGGGSAALVGATGAALGNMVASLTMGKKKYVDVQSEFEKLSARCTELQEKLLSLIDADARAFEPLAIAYRLPDSTKGEREAKETALQKALVSACEVPLEIMRVCAQALETVSVFANKGSVLAKSDAGCAAACLSAAMDSASLNVYINTKAMKNRELADGFNAQAAELLDKYIPFAREIFESVKQKLI